MAVVLQFVVGLIFGVGLLLAGMSDPAKVLNFLDIAAIPAGTWDASLAFVMAGAVAVTFAGYRLVLRRAAPLFAPTFHLPGLQRIDARLVTGTAIFGIGWGLAGFCPGPALTALGGGTPKAVVFVLAMIGGMIAGRWLAQAHDATPAARRT